MGALTLTGIFHEYYSIPSKRLMYTSNEFTLIHYALKFHGYSKQLLTRNVLNKVLLFDFNKLLPTRKNIG